MTDSLHPKKKMDEIESIIYEINQMLLKRKMELLNKNQKIILYHHLAEISFFDEKLKDLELLNPLENPQEYLKKRNELSSWVMGRINHMLSDEINQPIKIQTTLDYKIAEPRRPPEQIRLDYYRVTTHEAEFDGHKITVRKQDILKDKSNYIIEQSILDDFILGLGDDKIDINSVKVKKEGLNGHH